MAMQSGNVGVPDKIPWYNHHHYQLHMDEREGFMMWMRSEFAAANAIIDALCHHLQAVGEPGEYDGLVGCIQQRRCNWNAVLRMQQYFPVNEIIFALQQVGWRRQQRVTGFEGGARKENRRGGRGQRGGAEGQNLGNEVNGKDLNVHEKINANGNEKEKARVEENLDNTVEKMKDEELEDKELDEESEIASSRNGQESTQDAIAHIIKKTEGSGSADSAGLAQKLQENHSLTVIPKSYVASEICDGEPVNVVDGMKHYENLFEDSEVSKFISFVNDLRTSGRRGQLRGQTFTILKRPMKGRGRETIQLGVPSANAPHEDEISGTSKDLETEPIPSLLHDVIERLQSIQAITAKPDSCVIDIFNEGDHSQPHICPQWFGRPVCILFLTVCEMSFGKVIVADHPGVYRGSLKLSLSPGSVLVMEGRSSDFARHAIPSQRKQRMLVTLTKSQPNRFSSGDVPHVWTPSYWVPPPGRSPNHVRPGAAKHSGAVPTSVMQYAPAIHPRLSLPNGIQPIFVPSAAMTFPAPVALPPASASWTVAPSRHPQPRLPLPGTGVFLPPQASSCASNHATFALATENATEEASSLSDKESGLESSIGTSTSPDFTEQECNGSTDGTGGTPLIVKPENGENLDSIKLSGSLAK